MVVTRYNGNTTLTVRGPESKATSLHVSSVGAELFGIRSKLGTLRNAALEGKVGIRSHMR